MDRQTEIAIRADWQRMVDAEKLGTEALKETITYGFEKWKGDWERFATWALSLSQRLTEVIRNNNEELTNLYWSFMPQIMNHANEIKPCIDYRTFIDSFLSALENEKHNQTNDTVTQIKISRMEKWRS